MVDSTEVVGMGEPVELMESRRRLIIHDICTLLICVLMCVMIVININNSTLDLNLLLLG